MPEHPKGGDGMDRTTANQDMFPRRLFLLYVLFYAGQAIYNTYLNLYLSSVGLSDTQIGMAVSVSTAALLAAQLGWGILSDRARSKNGVLMLLYGCMAVASLLFYLNTDFWFLLLAVTLFSAFINPIVPLQDNYTLECLEGSRWDYGQIRMGGTIGYSVTVLFIGLALQDSYRMIFWMVALCMTACLLVCRGLPQVCGYQRQGGRKGGYQALLQNRNLLGMILINLVFSSGLNFFYNFYPIYYTSIGGDSSRVGMMMFACSVSEIPMLFFIHRIIRKIGVRGTLILSGGVTVLRWALLFLLRDPILVIPVNLLHGIGYTGFNYCLVTFIARTVPRELRATGQTLNAIISNVVSKIMFGMVGGLASDLLGVGPVMLVNAVVMAVAILIFARWSASNPALAENSSSAES